MVYWAVVRVFKALDVSVLFIYSYIYICDYLDRPCKKQDLVKASSIFEGLLWKSVLKSGLNWFLKWILYACSSSNKSLDHSCLVWRPQGLYNQWKRSLLALHFMILRKYVFVHQYIYAPIYRVFCWSHIWKRSLKRGLGFITFSCRELGEVLGNRDNEALRWIFCI